MKNVLQINFKIKAKTPELFQAFQRVAPRYAPGGDIKGLKWKIWLMNESDNTGGGIYLFEDQASVNEYLESDIVKMVKSSPALADIDIRVSNIVPELTKISRGPID